MCRNRSFNGAMGEIHTHRSDCADGGAIVPILEIRPPAVSKTSVPGGGWNLEGVCRNGTATGAEPGESCGGVFSVGCGVGNQEPHWEPLKESHSQAAQRSGKKICGQGDMVVELEVD